MIVWGALSHELQSVHQPFSKFDQDLTLLRYGGQAWQHDKRFLFSEFSKPQLLIVEH